MTRDNPTPQQRYTHLFAQRYRSPDKGKQVSLSVEKNEKKCTFGKCGLTNLEFPRQSTKSLVLCFKLFFFQVTGYKKIIGSVDSRIKDGRYARPVLPGARQIFKNCFMLKSLAIAALYHNSDWIT